MSENTTPREIDPTRIANLLSLSAERLDGGTLSALRRARTDALAKQAIARPAYTLSTGHHLHWPLPHTPTQWIAAIILSMAVIAGSIGYWHHTQEHEASYLDVAILTDDMPMEVFVDRYP